MEGTDIMVTEFKHKVIESRKWYDPEPSALRVSLETSIKDGEAFIVFNADAAWMTTEQAHQIIDYLYYLTSRVDELNGN